MVPLSPQIKTKIVAWVMTIFFVFSSFFVFNTVSAILVEEIGSVPQALQYVSERIGSIFFQNIGRKVINDFAFDAATYVGSGGKGQKALFVKEKWGNFWKNVGDKAAGDFIETFAKTVISDVASMNKKKDAAGDRVQCGVSRDLCVDAAQAKADASTSKTAEQDLVKAIESCNKRRDSCLQNLKPEIDQRADCDKNVRICKDNCNASGVSVEVGPSRSAEGVTACSKNCEVVYNYCWSNIAADRKAPTFDARNSPLANVSICNPRLDVLIRIQFGLTANHNNTNYQPNCSFSQMMNNWETEYDRQKAIFTNGNYLNDLAVYFRPGYNDLGVALQLRSSLGNYSLEAKTDSKAETTANGGWLDIRNFAGDLLGTPEQAKSRQTLTDEQLFDNLGKVTGDILVDAANIFINQLMIIGWQKLTGGLADDAGSTSPFNYWSSASIGRKAIENKISQIKDPVYSDGQRLNILTALASCENPENPGPTNCVIDTNFSNAITNKMTVGKAMDSGSLQKNWPFGFDQNGQEKIQYNQGYSYRSMLILRKYRVLPVGWELAAQKIQQAYLAKSVNALTGNQQNLLSSLGNDQLASDVDRGKLKEGVSLEDMVSCFDYQDKQNTGKDKYDSYGADWCKGLIDPNWVLKLPDYYCARQGFGPELVQDFQVQDNTQKSCGRMNPDTGAVSKVLVDGSFKTCSTDSSCCTRLENANKLKNPEASCYATCDYEESKLVFARGDKYCADEQSCLKEDSSGKCLAYGYCTAERRQWVFNQKGQDKSCEPYMNTCKSYNGNGKNVSYLENTLDFNNCSADNSGCRAYAVPESFDVAGAKALWAKKPVAQIYFDAQAVKCSQNSEGCHQFVRTQIDGGTNFIADAGFEAGDKARWQAFGDLYNAETPNFDATLVASGGSSLHVDGIDKGLVFSPANRSLLPKAFEFETNQTYTLSANIYVQSGVVELGIGDSARDNYTAVEASSASWNKYTVTADNDFSLQADSFRIIGLGQAEFYVDDVKLEVGGPTAYNDYGTTDLAYQKLLPSYLERTCYVDPPLDYSLKANAPAICATFVRKCNKEEVGCNLFTDLINKDQIAAKVKLKDYCPNECVGYDKFVQQDNNFYSARLAHFIPRTAKTCQASSEGCSLFVNLDKVPEGGEENEAYAEFRRCTKPDESCTDFITWEGSDVSGYQITSFKLQSNLDNKNLSQPKTVVDADASDDVDSDENGNELCSENIFKLSADHPLYNPDCRQFFGKDGNVSYHLYSKTVLCTNDCYFYRQVEQNIDETIANQPDCEAKIANGLGDKKGQWLEETDQCVVCRNGGTWDETHKACVFKAFPAESTTCAKVDVGCSKYVGDTGHNLKTIFNDTFEGNNDGAWLSGTSKIEITKDALAVGGHSLAAVTDGPVLKYLSGTIKPGKKYTLSFMARRRDQEAKINSISLSVGVALDTSSLIDFTTDGNGLALTNAWRSYKFVIDNVETDKPLLLLSFSGLVNAQEIRFDSIKLVEADDTYYLVKNSWQTPETCDQDHRGRPFPYYMSGCRAYTDMNGSRQTLRSFDELCQNSAAGCELMINTFNSSFYGESTINGIKTQADEMAYVVYDKKKSCADNQKGCQLVGRLNRIGALTNAYINNNPDTYNESLCTKDALYCETWNQGGNSVYFKDPGEKTCEYLSPEGGSEGWYIKKQQYCFGNQTCTDDASCGEGQACVSDDKGAKYCSSKNLCAGPSDCATGESCKATSDNVPCPVTYHKTIGQGVAVAKLQPYGMADIFKNDNGQDELGNAGLCTNDVDGCTEYVDPESKFNFNLLADNQDEASLKLDTLYILKSGAKEATAITCSDSIKIYQINHATNEVPLDSEQTSMTVNPKDGKAFSQEFYVHDNSQQNNSETVDCKVIGAEASLREAVVAYRIKDSISKETPTVAKFDEGKILFNERSQNGRSKKALVYSTSLTDDVLGSAPGSVNAQQTPPFNNANTLLAVDPDRTCGQWLSCKTYIFNPLKPDEKICVERNLCDRLNKANECSHFVSFAPTLAGVADKPVNQLYGAANGVNVGSVNLENVSNMSGYNIVSYNGANGLNDYYHLAGMKEVSGNKIKIDSNGSFEGLSTTGFKTADGLDVMTVSDPKLVEKDLGLGAYRDVPDGQAIGKINSSNAYVDIDNPGSVELVVSIRVFLRTATKASVRLGAPDGKSCPVSAPACTASSDVDAGNKLGATGVLAETDIIGKWVSLTGKFEVSKAYEPNQKLRLWLNADGIMYFDDVKVQQALAYRYDSSKGREQYMQSVCRLFPQRDSLSCDYFDGSGLRRKGWSGYCLQYDPRNSKQCLMWYPVDKIASDEFEEGAGLSIDKDLYYCVEAEDRCGSAASNGSPVVPEFACKTFVKVNKEKYWHGRISEGSNYRLDTRIFNGSGKLLVDFGVESQIKPGGKVDASLNSGIDWRQGSGFYGAYSSDEALDAPNSSGQPQAAGVTGSANAKRVTPFLPFYGRSRAGEGGKDDEYFCRATISEDGKDMPFEVNVGTGSDTQVNVALGVYDDCFVDLAAEWELTPSCENSTGLSKDYDCCGVWNPLTHSCSNNGDDEISQCNGKGYCYCDNKTLFPKGCKNYYCWDNGLADNTKSCGLNEVGYPFMSRFSFIGDADPGVRCAIRRPTSMTGGKKDSDYADDKEFVAHVNDLRWDGSNVGCMFSCFNATKAYNVGAKVENSYYAVQRLFTGLDGFYEWKDSAYVEKALDGKGDPYKASELLQAMTRCKDSAGNILDKRPPFDAGATKKADYCYIKPTVDDVQVYPAKILNQGYVTLSFTSRVDPEQLPLRRVVIDLGVDSNGQRVEKYFNLSVFDHRDPKNPHKFVLSYDVADLNLPEGKTEVRPCVTIYDNWHDSPTVLADPEMIGKGDMVSERQCLEGDPLIIERSKKQ